MKTAHQRALFNQNSLHLDEWKKKEKQLHEESHVKPTRTEIGALHETETHPRGHLSTIERGQSRATINRKKVVSQETPGIFQIKGPRTHVSGHEL